MDLRCLRYVSPSGEPYFATRFSVTHGDDVVVPAAIASRLVEDFPDRFAESLDPSVAEMLVADGSVALYAPFRAAEWHENIVEVAEDEGIAIPLTIETRVDTLETKVDALEGEEPEVGEEEAESTETGEEEAESTETGEEEAISTEVAEVEAASAPVASHTLSARAHRKKH